MSPPGRHRWPRTSASSPIVSSTTKTWLAETRVPCACRQGCAVRSRHSATAGPPAGGPPGPARPRDGSRGLRRRRRRPRYCRVTQDQTVGPRQLTSPSPRAGQPWTTRRQPRYEQASTAGPGPYQRSRTSRGPGDTTSTVMDDRSHESCRNRRPAPSSKGAQKVTKPISASTRPAASCCGVSAATTRPRRRTAGA
jgi:hypothetical protein